MTGPAEQQDPDDLRRSLSRWLQRTLPDARDLEVSSLSAPSAGYSGDTTLFDCTYQHSGARIEQHLVLRRSSAHPLFLDADVGLQWNAMEAAASCGLPVPELVWFEPDPDALGAPFFVMKRVDGLIPPDWPSHHVDGWIKELTTDERARLIDNSMNVLASLHAPGRADAFGFLPSPGSGSLGSYLDWIARWFDWARQDQEYDVVRRGIDYLVANRPHDPGPSVVLWGDARLGNLVFDGSLAVEAILDWEMATVGPAEVDLAWWLMMNWFWSDGMGVTALDAIADRAPTIASYERAAGRTIGDLTYYDVLALVRFSIVIIRQVTRRIETGEFDRGRRVSRSNPVLARLDSMLDAST